MEGEKLRADRDKKYIGSVEDPECKENTIKPIDRVICRNNCKHWKKKKCLRGYKVKQVKKLI